MTETDTDPNLTLEALLSGEVAVYADKRALSDHELETVRVQHKQPTDRQERRFDFSQE